MGCKKSYSIPLSFFGRFVFRGHEVFNVPLLTQCKHNVGAVF